MKSSLPASRPGQCDAREILCSTRVAIVARRSPRRSGILEEQVNKERGRGPPPFCLGGWGSRGWTQPFLRNGRPVRLLTPIFRFFGISSIGLPLFGFRLLKK